MSEGEQADGGLDSAEFCQQVEWWVAEEGLSYMDAILHVCEKNELDIDSIGPLVNPRIQEFVRREASRLRMIPAVASLPF